MNLENIDIVKISDSNYKIYQLDKSINKRVNLDLEFDGISSPFGLEEFYHVHYINWEIDSPTLQTLSKLELEFKDIVLQSNPKYNQWSWISNIKERKGFDPLLKTRIPQCKGKFQVETNESISLYEIDYKSKLKIKVTLDSIWFNEKNKTFGLLWLTKSIWIL
jgi:hypothetical protein